MSMPFDNADDSETIANEDAAGGSPQPNNRMFLIIAGILGAIVILALICVVVYTMFLRPGQLKGQLAAQTSTAQAVSLANSVKNTEAADQATKAARPTNTPVPPTAAAPKETKAVVAAVTATPSSTPVIALAATATSNVAAAGTPNLTQTVAALITQGANAQKTTTAIATSTLLPKSGFAEDIGLPGLLGLAVVLVAVIFIARRLRS